MSRVGMLVGNELAEAILRADRRLRIARMAAVSWKARQQNGGYWREVWKKCNRKGCRWQLRLRWTHIPKRSKR